MEKIIAVFERCNKIICTFCLLSMVLLIFANTCLRYLFHTSIIQAEELTRYLFIWATFLGVISMYREGKHIAVTTITDRLKPRTLRIFNIVFGFGALYALGILLQGSIIYYMETTTMGQVTNIPYKFAAAPVVFASACCLGIVITDMIRNFRALTRGEE